MKKYFFENKQSLALRAWRLSTRGGSGFGGKIGNFRRMRVGFTIIELLMAMAIISVLAGVFIATYPASQKRARDSKRTSDIKQYQAALAAYSNKTGGVYPSPAGTVVLTSLCTTIGVSDCPDDPKAPAQNYRYQADSGGTRFVIWVELEISSDDWAACSNGLVGTLGSTPTDGNCPIVTAITSMPTATPPPTAGPTSTPGPTATAAPSSSPTPTPGAIITVTFNPIADSYVRASNPNNNYGSSSTMEVDGSPVKITYIKFDLSSLAGKNVVSANLRFRICTASGCSSSSTQNVKQVSDNSWTESGITYNNRPGLSSTISSFSGGSKGQWVQVDVTSYASTKTGQLMSLGIDSSGSNGLDFYSKEAPDVPELVVEYTN